MITFYEANPALWNHGTVEYRDRNLRHDLLQKLVLEFDEKFSEKEIKKEWNTLSTYYKREKQKELLSKPSGVGTEQVFKSNWEHLDQMVFLETTSDRDDSLNTLEQDKNLKSLPSKKAKFSQERDARAALWTALANFLNSQTSSLQANIAGTQEKSQNTLAERAKLFGEIVADNLLQCDPKDWTMLKKKIFDLFYDYEQRILNGAQQSLPINANSFAFVAFGPLTQHNSHLRQPNMTLANASHNQRNIYNSIISPSSNSSD